MQRGASGRSSTSNCFRNPDSMPSRLRCFRVRTLARRIATQSHRDVVTTPRCDSTRVHEVVVIRWCELSPSSRCFDEISYGNCSCCFATQTLAHAATGTTDLAPIDPQLFCQQLERETGRNRAASREELTPGGGQGKNRKPQQLPGFVHESAGDSTKAGEGTRTLNIQHGRLALCH